MAAGARLLHMTDTLESLQRRMEAAARVLDFEEAGRCRDKISLIRGGAKALDLEDIDLSGLDRQKPGAMGLGTSQQRLTPPNGWRPPQKPDPMTKSRSQGASRRRDR